MDPTPVTTRRTALKILGTGAAALAVGPWRESLAAEATPTAKERAMMQPFVLAPLGYAYDALEPHIDARTMEIHHTKHHQAYITNATNALASQPALQNRSAESLLRDLNSLPESVRVALRNNVGGHVNHAFFWQIIRPGGAKAPGGALAESLMSTFGSLDAFKTQFADAAAKRFGSGWAWLVKKEGKLAVISSANQDSPLSEGAMPIIGLDVWEHAYYLKYQNRRPDYVAAFWNVVNWDQAGKNFTTA